MAKDGREWQRQSNRVHYKDIDEKLWNASFDVALTAFISVKLEKLLTQLLTELVCLDPKILELLEPEQNINNEQERLRKLSKKKRCTEPEKKKVRKFLAIDVQSLTLGALIRVYSDTKATSALRELGIFNRGKPDMTHIKDIRNSMFHYSERSFQCSPPNLEQYERKDLIDRYNAILINSDIFKTLYTEDKAKMWIEYWSVINVNYYRGLLKEYNRAKEELEQRTTELEKSQKQSRDLDSQLDEEKSKHEELKKLHKRVKSQLDELSYEIRKRQLELDVLAELPEDEESKETKTQTKTQKSQTHVSFYYHDELYGHPSVADKEEKGTKKSEKKAKQKAKKAEQQAREKLADQETDEEKDNIPTVVPTEDDKSFNNDVPMWEAGVVCFTPVKEK